jgi:23S rRNA pseudouridine2605 synthase
MALERLQKILARAGVSSRRAAERLIVQGRVRVNGRVVTELGSRADAHHDKVEVDGRRATAETPVYVLLHKPRGVVSTVSDPEGRRTVLDLLEGVGARVFPVGRLDFQTSGALLLTNDGELAAALLHPKHHVPKTYLAKLEGEMSDEVAARWRSGVELDDGRTLPADVRVVRREQGKTTLEVVLREGRNQQIRRMGEACGLPVLRLTRLAFAGIGIEGLRPGGWRLLLADELRKLRAEFGVPRRIRPALAHRDRPEPRPPSRRDARRAGGAPKGRAPRPAAVSSREGSRAGKPRR